MRVAVGVNDAVIEGVVVLEAVGVGDDGKVAVGVAVAVAEAVADVEAVIVAVDVLVAVAVAKGVCVRWCLCRSVSVCESASGLALGWMLATWLRSTSVWRWASTMV